MSMLCSNWFMVSVRRGFIDAFGKMNEHEKLELQSVIASRYSYGFFCIHSNLLLASITRRMDANQEPGAVKNGEKNKTRRKLSAYNITHCIISTFFQVSLNS